MRHQLLLALLAWAGVGLPVQAQQPAETASREFIADALQALKIDASREGDTFCFDWKNRSFSLERLDDGKQVLIKTSIAREPSLRALNRYNELIAVTTRAVRYEKSGVVLESGLDCRLGITGVMLQKFVGRFREELADFEEFIAKQPDRVPIEVRDKSDDKEFVIKFPTNDPKNWETAWKIEWDIVTAQDANKLHQFKFPADREGPVLFKIKKAYFKPGQKAPWIQVLEDAHPSEFYVPYLFKETRFFDLRDAGEGYVPLSPREGGQRSKVLSESKRVMAELRDRGIVYKNGDTWTRRGEELTLWANFAAGNYTYLVEFGFYDDGTVALRHAPTGWNFSDHPGTIHMHNCYWRTGIKLGPDGGNANNKVDIIRLSVDPKNQGNLNGKLDPPEEVQQERYVDWNPRHFTRIRVSNPSHFASPLLEKKKLPIAYEMVMQAQGIARHDRPTRKGELNEKFTLHDFWITRHDCPNKMSIHLGDYFHTADGKPNPDLLPLKDQNVVLWLSSSALHIPRPEDGYLEKGAGLLNGQALTSWSSIELRPRNLFERTPIYRPIK